MTSGTALDKVSGGSVGTLVGTDGGGCKDGSGAHQRLFSSNPDFWKPGSGGGAAVPEVWI